MELACGHHPPERDRAVLDYCFRVPGRPGDDLGRVANDCLRRVRVLLLGPLSVAEAAPRGAGSATRGEQLRRGTASLVRRNVLDWLPNS